jgi:hypothetical protein
MPSNTATASEWLWGQRVAGRYRYVSVTTEVDSIPPLNCVVASEPTSSIRSHMRRWSQGTYSS